MNLDDANCSLFVMNFLIAGWLPIEKAGLIKLKHDLIKEKSNYECIFIVFFRPSDGKDDQ